MNDFISLFTAATLNVAVQGEWSYIGQCDNKRHMLLQQMIILFWKIKRKEGAKLKAKNILYQTTL